MKPRTVVSGIKLDKAPRIPGGEQQRFYSIANPFTAKAQPAIHDYFVENHAPLGTSAPAPQVPPTPPVTTMGTLPGAESGERKWFQFLTHDAKGEFSNQRTIVSAAIVAAVVMGVAAMTRKHEEERTIPAEGLAR